MKPLMNLDVVEFDDVEPNGLHTSSLGQISDHIGARGGPEVGHQIINTGTKTMRYIALSTLTDVEACEYPDSRKIMVVAGKRGQRRLRKMFRAGENVDYYDREKTRPGETSCHPPK